MCVLCSFSYFFLHFSAYFLCFVLRLFYVFFFRFFRFFFFFYSFVFKGVEEKFTQFRRKCMWIFLFFICLLVFCFRKGTRFFIFSPTFYSNLSFFFHFLYILITSESQGNDPYLYIEKYGHSNTSTNTKPNRDKEKTRKEGRIYNQGTCNCHTQNDVTNDYWR